MRFNVGDLVKVVSPPSEDYNVTSNNNFQSYYQEHLEVYNSHKILEVIWISSKTDRSHNSDWLGLKDMYYCVPINSVELVYETH